MGTCMSLSTAKATDQDPNLVPGSRPSKRWKWVDRDWSLGRGLFDRWVDPDKTRSNRGFTEDQLHSVQGRLILNGATKAGCLFTQQGRKGTNQDAMVLWENFASREDTIFCGVFDGHGPYGHMVAKKVRDALPIKVCNQWKAIDDGHGGSTNSEENASVNIDEETVEPTENGEFEKFPEVYKTLKQSLLTSFKLMDKELKLHPAIDCFCSGSTAVTLIKQGCDLIIGNIGDSRAILGTRDKNNKLVAVQLTVDLKPNLPREAARIQQCKGRVFALQDEPEVPRVWLPNSDSPGLAMARAFGDFCLKDYGLISVPDVSYRQITDRDEFVVLATDGIWDALSNMDVVHIVASAPTRSTAARTLVDCAVREWRTKFPTSKIDDCAVICLFLNRPFSMESSRVGNENPEPTPMVSTQHEVTDSFESLPSPKSPHGNALQEMFPPVGIDEIVPIDGITDVTEPCQDAYSEDKLSNQVVITEEEWTALDGVTRVNTLLNLPRFRSGDVRLAGKKGQING